MDAEVAVNKSELEETIALLALLDADSAAAKQIQVDFLAGGYKNDPQGFRRAVVGALEDEGVDVPVELERVDNFDDVLPPGSKIDIPLEAVPAAALAELEGITNGDWNATVEVDALSERAKAELGLLTQPEIKYINIDPDTSAIENLDIEGKLPTDTTLPLTFEDNVPEVIANIEGVTGADWSTEVEVTDTADNADNNISDVVDTPWTTEVEVTDTSDEADSNISDVVDTPWTTEVEVTDTSDVAAGNISDVAGDNYQATIDVQAATQNAWNAIRALTRSETKTIFVNTVRTGPSGSGSSFMSLQPGDGIAIPDDPVAVQARQPIVNNVTVNVPTSNPSAVVRAIETWSRRNGALPTNRGRGQ